MTMHELAQKLYPLPRSITGKGFRDSLKIIADFLNTPENRERERE